MGCLVPFGFVGGFEEVEEEEEEGAEGGDEDPDSCGFFCDAF